MQATVYEGYFNGGQFYTSGKVVQIPEQQRVIIAILDEAQVDTRDKLAEWHDTKRMIAESAHENHLLANDAFKRGANRRMLINFSGEGEAL